MDTYNYLCRNINHYINFNINRGFSQYILPELEKKGNKLALLHCVLNYPTPDENANLGMILDLKHFHFEINLL